MEWIGQKEQEEGNCPILSHGFDSKFDVWNPQWTIAALSNSNNSELQLVNYIFQGAIRQKLDYMNEYVFPFIKLLFKPDVNTNIL